MSWMGWVRRRLRVLFSKEAEEAELDEEIRSHLELEIRQHVEAGMDPAEARRRALLDFGGVERFKEQVRDLRGVRFLDDFLQDSRVALRSLVRQPGFALAVVLTLGLGIGGNVAMFSVLERSVFRPLPYADSEELVFGRVTRQGNIGQTVSGPDFFDYREKAESFDELAAMTPLSVAATVTGAQGPERIRVVLVSPGFFETFSLRPAAGRFFLPKEGEPGGADVVVLSHDYWERRYARDAAVVGTAVSIDGRPRTVVGVAPAGFRFYQDADVWRPIRRGEGSAVARQFHNFVLVGRLKRGTGLAAAQAEIDGISSRLEEMYPDTNRDKGLNLTPLREALTERYRPALAILEIAVAALLLIACANVAGLLLARGSARRAEIAVRSAMGAGRGRIARHLLTESAYLVLAASAVGLTLSISIQRGVLAFLPMTTLGDMGAALTPRTVLFAVALSVLTAFAIGVLPAFRMTHEDLAADIKLGGRGQDGGGRSALGGTLVVAQIAMTVVLLAVSGLLLRSLGRMLDVELGFDTSHLIAADVSIPRGTYRDAAAAARFYTELRDRVAAIPGVSSVGITSHVPIRDGFGNITVTRPEDFGARDPSLDDVAYERSVLPGYFEAMGIPLLEGRDVQTSDGSDAPRVVVLSRELATRLFGDADPLGETVAVDAAAPEPELRQVVGVVGDIVVSNVRAPRSRNQAMYLPYEQGWTTIGSLMHLVVRARTDAAPVVARVRQIVAALDSDVPVTGVSTMDQIVSRSLADRRALALALGAFAAVAVLLAAVGLYGSLAYQVSRRAHEIAVRMALGASVSRVSRGILARGVRLVAVGLCIGIPGAYVGGRVVRGLLFGVAPADPATLLGVAAFLAAVAVLACLLPALRAARVDPGGALRSS